jgi:DNA-binding IclR family transcriptional regulator
MAEREKYRVPAVVAASKILELLASSEFENGAKQSDLAVASGISRSSAHNLLATLEELRYVERDPDTKVYRLGGTLVALGIAASRADRMTQLAVESIQDLAADTGLSYALARVNSGPRAVVTDSAYPPAGLHVGITLGDAYGLFDGAVGKVLLAGMEPGLATEAIKGARLERRTAATITSPARLTREVNEVRGRGWASSIKEFNENHAVAAGVWGIDGRQELVLLALGFPAQISAEEIPRVGRSLRMVADSITAACGGSENGWIQDPSATTTGPSRAKRSKTA